MAPSGNRLPDSGDRQPGDFSIVLGGPLFQAWRRTHLSGSALELLGRRIVVLALLAWLPLLLLSAADGQLLGGTATVPFLLDVEAHVRFLVALPLLIAAELTVHRRMRLVASQFVDRRLIPAAQKARFDAIVASAHRLRNSVAAEVLLIAIVYGVGVFIIWRQFVALDTSTWYATPSSDGAGLSLAGSWHVYVSLPIFQFLVLRWYFRAFIWARFLAQVSRIRLNLAPLHPDRVGGLGFLSSTVYAFAPLAFAHGAILAGALANRIFYTGGALLDYRYEILALVALVLAVVLGPLLLFAWQLWDAKLNGSKEFGMLAERYVREFDAKWIRGAARADEPLVGSADIQSLADLGASYEVVKSMQLAPISTQAMLIVVVATLVPVLPLTLTMMPLAELLKKLVGLFF